MKFKVTPARVSEACGYVEVLNLIGKDRPTAFRVVPRFAVDKDDAYLMSVKYDDDGEISEFVGYLDTLDAMAQVPPKRLEKLIDELSEAAKNVVNPPNGTG